MRLKDRVAIVVGSGQSPGEGMGNGRATAMTFAREGAKVLCVDHNLGSAEETVGMIRQSKGKKVNAISKATMSLKASLISRAWLRMQCQAAGAASISCTTMSPASRWQAAMPNCSRYPRRRSTAASRSI